MRTTLALEDARRAIDDWRAKRLWIYVHAFDLEFSSGGVSHPICVAYVQFQLLTGEDRIHSLQGFLRDKDPQAVQESILGLTDHFIADWVESNK